MNMRTIIVLPMLLVSVTLLHGAATTQQDSKIIAAATGTVRVTTSATASTSTAAAVSSSTVSSSSSSAASSHGTVTEPSSAELECRDMYDLYRQRILKSEFAARDAYSDTDSFWTSQKAVIDLARTHNHVFVLTKKRTRVSTSSTGDISGATRFRLAIAKNPAVYIELMMLNNDPYSDVYLEHVPMVVNDDTQMLILHAIAVIIRHIRTTQPKPEGDSYIPLPCIYMVIRGNKATTQAMAQMVYEKFQAAVYSDPEQIDPIKKLAIINISRLSATQTEWEMMKHLQFS